MNIAQALKQKNRIGERISTLRDEISTNNKHTIIQGTVYRKGIVKNNDRFTELYKLVTELAELKKKIAIAVAPVADKLSLLTEYKAVLSESIKTLDTNEKALGHYNPQTGSQVYIEYEVDIKEDARVNIVKDLESKIIMLQDELDVYNAMTQI